MRFEDSIEQLGISAGYSHDADVLAKAFPSSNSTEHVAAEDATEAIARGRLVVDGDVVDYVQPEACNEWEAADSAVLYLKKPLWPAPGYAELGSGAEPFTKV